MNCDCVKRIENNLAVAPFIVDKAGDGIKVTCAATVLQMTDDMNLRSVINIPFRIRGTGKGFIKGKEMPCAAKYCPFCGRSADHYAEGSDEGIAAAFPLNAGAPTDN